MPRFRPRSISSTGSYDVDDFRTAGVEIEAPPDLLELGRDLGLEPTELRDDD